MPGEAEQGVGLLTEPPERMVAALVSVVIPVYNAREWLPETLASVLGQTYPELEIIVVDDGSTDGSGEAAKQTLEGGRRAHKVLRTSNGGPSRARNLGWQAARGEWIQFLDADDLLAPEKISNQMSTAAALPAEAAVVHSPWQRIELVGSTWQPAGSIVSPRVGPDVLGDLLRADNVVCTGSHIVRRSWLCRVGGYDARRWVIEDIHLLLRIAMAGGQFRASDPGKALSFYRTRAQGSLSRRSRREFVEGCCRNAEMVEAHWRSRDEVTPSRAAILAGIYLSAARYFANVDRPEFERSVARMFDLAPDYLPAGPPMFRLAWRLIGYRNTEQLARVYRRLKGVLLWSRSITAGSASQ